MVLASSTGTMEKSIKETGTGARCKERESSSLAKTNRSRESSGKDCLGDWVSGNGQMETTTRESIAGVISKAQDFSSVTSRAGNMMASGIREE